MRLFNSPILTSLSANRERRYLGRTAGAEQVVADPGKPAIEPILFAGRRIREISLFVQQRCIFEPIDAVQRK